MTGLLPDVNWGFVAYHMKKILVTGADGFIGSHLVEHLVRCNCEVRAFAFYNSFNSWGWLDDLSAEVLSKIEVVTGDIRDPHGVRSAMQGCDTVLHLAALIAIPFSYHSPDAYVETNVRGTLNLLQAARDLGVRRFVHTSTSEVYGTAQTVPITETHPLHAQSPYAATKIAADQLALSFHRSFDLPVVVIRPFNTFGPRQSARAVIPSVITQLASRRKPIKLGALHPTRDLTFVTDTVRGFVAAAEAENVEGEVINLGTGHEISIGDLAELIGQLMGTPTEIVVDSQRLRPAKSEVERLVSSNRKAQQLLNWAPEYNGRDGLIRGLEVTIKWFADPANLKKYKADIYNV